MNQTNKMNWNKERDLDIKNNAIRNIRKGAKDLNEKKKRDKECW